MTEPCTPNDLKPLVAIYNELKQSGQPAKEALKSALQNFYPQIETHELLAQDVWVHRKALFQICRESIAANWEKGVTIECAKNDVEGIINSFISKLRYNPYEGGQNAFSVFLERLMVKQPEDDFLSATFAYRTYTDNTPIPLCFPSATLSFLGGRPGAGKTTALTSLAMEALRNTQKKVLFVTSEETPQQLFLRFIKNQCYHQNRGTCKFLNPQDFSKILKSYRNTSAASNAQWKRVFQAADTVRTFTETGRLQLFNLDKTTTFEELTEALQTQTPHSIILIDYIQNLPYPPQNTPTHDRLEVLRREMYELNKTLKQCELIGIAGAQLNRQSANEHHPERLELKALADCGEAERKAHIVIGLGYKITDNHEKEYFYRIMKNREGTISGHFKLYGEPAYSYVDAQNPSSGQVESYRFEDEPSTSVKKEEDPTTNFREHLKKKLTTQHHHA